MRRRTRTVKIGDVTIGGKAPISVQSMTKTDTRNVRKTVRQIHELTEAGCEIVRVAVPDREAVKSLGTIKKKVNIPVVADIHFNSKFAIEAIREGVDCIRLNPGNIYKADQVRRISEEALKKNIPIRVGINSGSLKWNGRGSVSRAMVISAMTYTRMLEKFGFKNIIVSLKTSDVQETVRAYELMAEKCNYPFHLGITAAGPAQSGSIKSAVGMGILLSKGLGDTIRVSLTGNPIEEVRVAYEILGSLGLREREPVIISCPTCGRCQVNLVKIVRDVGKQLREVYSCEKLAGLKVAVMGCPVNGPGEAKEADIGVACGKGMGILFRKGKIVKKVSEGKMVSSLVSELKALRR